MTIATENIQQFADLDGQPLEAGKLYFGVDGGNPETQPIAIFWDKGLTQPAAQPVRTIGGYPSYFGTPANIYVSTAKYSLTVKDKNDRLLRYVASAVFTLEDDLLSSSGGNFMNFNVGGTGAVTRSMASKVQEVKTAMDFGALQDASTDATADLIQMANDAVVMGRKVVMIPPNVKFDYYALMAGAPTGITFLNFSGINDYTSAGETTRIAGLIGTSVAVNDMAWAIEDAHHPYFIGNNLGTAGSTSAANRLYSNVWAAGKYKLGALDKRGWRACAMLQFRKESATTWSYGMRSLAPWVSINGEYEIWSSSETIPGAGVHRVNGDNHYVSAGAIASGGAAPVHTSGTVNNWTWLDSSDRGIWLVDQLGRWLLGNGSFAATWRHKVNPTDPVQAYIGELAAGGISQVSLLKLIPTDGAAAEAAVPILGATTVNGNSLNVIKSDGSSALVSFTDSAGATIHCQAASFFENTSGGGSQDLGGKYVIFMNPSSPFSLSTITAPAGALLELHFGVNATTLVHSGSLRLTGSVNFTSTLGSVITLRKIPASISDAVWEVSRSLK